LCLSLPSHFGIGVAVLVLFLSSRRRHTRFSRDWSSDVCSSDLRSVCPARRGKGPEAKNIPSLRPPSSTMSSRGGSAREKTRKFRSEERRVGKEGSARWAPENCKNK